MSIFDKITGRNKKTAGTPTDDASQRPQEHAGEVKEAPAFTAAPADATQADESADLGSKTI